MEAIQHVLGEIVAVADLFRVFLHQAVDRVGVVLPFRRFIARIQLDKLITQLERLVGLAGAIGSDHAKIAALVADADDRRLPDLVGTRRRLGLPGEAQNDVDLRILGGDGLRLVDGSLIEKQKQIGILGLHALDSARQDLVLVTELPLPILLQLLGQLRPRDADDTYLRAVVGCGGDDPGFYQVSRGVLVEEIGYQGTRRFRLVQNRLRQRRQKVEVDLILADADRRVADVLERLHRVLELEQRLRACLLGDVAQVGRDDRPAAFVQGLQEIVAASQAALLGLRAAAGLQVAVLFAGEDDGNDRLWPPTVDWHAFDCLVVRGYLRRRA